MRHILLALLAAPLLCADTFPEIYNSEPGNPQPMPASEALGKLRMPEGFQATVFAAEPDVQNPIACAWDHRGRLWVAENYTYAESAKRFDLGLNDRVIILEDKDNDGHAETRTVFTDQVKMLTSVELAPDGVYLMCPPQLLFIPDRNHDDIPDGPPEVVLDGFDVGRDSYHTFANGLRFGPDGWLYGRSGIACPGRIGKPGTADKDRLPIVGGIWRYHTGRGTAEVLCSGTTNPWGHDWDEHGEMFFSNTVIGHLWHMIPGAHFKSMYGAGPNPAAYERMDQTADHYHFDTTGSWEESRDGKANDLGGGHSHIGGMIYQADQWPEQYRGKYMTLNQHGRRVNVERLERQGSGYVAKHEPDMIFSDDPWFRGIDLTTGPDGSVFILDWSDTGECHDHTGVHRESGRIYKISYGKPGSPELALLEDLSPDGIGKIIRHPNAWYYRQMRIRLSGKPLSDDVAASIRQIADHADESTPLRLRAFSVLFAHGMLETDDITKLVKSGDEHLRVFGIRCLVDGLPIDRADGVVLAKPDDIPGQNDTVLTVANQTTSSGLVRLALTSALQRMPSPERHNLAQGLAADRMTAEDPVLANMIWIATANDPGGNLENILSLSKITRSPELLGWSARYMALNSRKHPGAFAGFLAHRYQPELKIHLLRGIADGLAGITSAPEPDPWGSFADSITDPAAKPLVQKISIIFGNTSAIEAIKATVLDGNAPMGERQQALDILIETRAPGTFEICQKVVSTPTLNGNALRGLALSKETSTAKLIVANYETFLPANRPALMDHMAGRADWAGVLLDGIAAGKIPRSALPAHSARRIRDLKQEALSKKLDEVWGTLKESPEAKRKEISTLKEKLTPETLAGADLTNGKQTYAMVCGACHMLNGEGGNLGPDLTGSGRDNIDYLLENIVDPSAVVVYENRVTTVELKDGRTLAGIITAKTPDTITLKLPTGENILELSTILSQETSDTSIMPEGLLTTLSDGQVRDLIAFLMKKD